MTTGGHLDTETVYLLGVGDHPVTNQTGLHGVEAGVQSDFLCSV